MTKPSSVEWGPYDELTFTVTEAGAAFSKLKGHALLTIHPDTKDSEQATLFFDHITDTSDDGLFVALRTA